MTVARESTAASWADAFAPRAVPVLRASAAALARMAQRAEDIRPREVAAAVLRDPMLTLAVLRHLRTHHSRRMLEDITTVEHAIMMLGVRRFFDAFRELPVMEDALAAEPGARAGLLGVVCRARAAAIYAGMLAGLRADAVPDELAAAALLSDLAELLLWCYEPHHAADIATRMSAQPGLRSAAAQQEVLGFRLAELQLELARRWDLPPLIQSLMDESHAERARVRSVTLAVGLARHAQHGWRDAALPSDLEGIASLAAITAAEAESHVFDAALRVVIDRGRYGAGLPMAPLPPLPPRAEAGDTEASVAQVVPAGAYDRSREWLDRLARGERLPGQSRGGIVRDARHEQLAAVAALIDGITNGLGFALGLFISPVAGSWQKIYFAGDECAAPSSPPYADEQTIADLANGTPACSRCATPGLPQDAGQPRFLAWPVMHEGRLCAAAFALTPFAPDGVEAASCRRFRELGEAFDAALRSLPSPPHWIVASAEA